jgi:hypothetical protein
MYFMENLYMIPHLEKNTENFERCKKQQQKD